MLADARRLPLGDAGKQEMIARRDVRLPFGLDHDRLMILDDESGTVDAVCPGQGRFARRSAPRASFRW